MTLTEKEVDHIAVLARLRLDPGERARLTRELAAILDYVAKLNELDLEGVSPMSHVAESPTPMRPDVVEPSPAVEEALALAPSREGRLFRVPRVVG
jgi:aspartyl-tRNA(Asn)/glutamyl-tRNA(Gln) amidotransferase subunit C